MLTVRRIEAGLCRLPLDQPIRLGSITYRTRDYVAVRLTDEHETEGHALGFARGVGVIEGIGNLSPLVIGQAFAAPGDLIRTVRRAFVPGWPGLIRSASLLDIAMWDIAAKQAGLPLSGFMSSLSDTDDPMRNLIPVVAIV